MFIFFSYFFFFFDASQFRNSLCLKCVNIFALKSFLFEFKQTFGSDVMVDLIKNVS